jgi:hypothetical protein
MDTQNTNKIEPIVSQIAGLSIADLAGLVDAIIAQIAAVEAVINKPAFRDHDTGVLHDLLNEADNRLKAAGEELQARRAADNEERDVRFRGLLSYAAMTCGGPEDLAQAGFADIATQKSANHFETRQPMAQH